MINSNDLQEKLDERREIEKLLNDSLLKGPCSNRSISIKQDDDVKKILKNKTYAMEFLKEHGYKVTIINDGSLAGGFDGIPKSIKIEW
ncbi:hypothetical protein [Carnobacterium maltaromaticum]|uniref:hypothetical protein n=1 Tax=Carnobacterium maltaromaticum TaxID=2751 RepID=UPI0012F7A9D2|nr:hypothetical protein [Carnobacterium maltaromaticum]